MKKVVSQDAVRRAFAAVDEDESAAWLQRHLDRCTAPLLAEPSILDMDTTVKPLYGHQQGAIVGYNPKQPGRPSHTYHTFAMAGTRLVIDVEVHAGNQHTSNYSAPGLSARLDVAARRRGLWRRSDHGRSRGTRSSLSVQVAPDLQRQAYDRAPSPWGEWIDAGQGLAGIGERGPAGGLEPAAPRGRVAPTRDGSARLVAQQRSPPATIVLRRHRFGRGASRISSSGDDFEAHIESFGQPYRDRGDDESLSNYLNNPGIGPE